MNKHYINRHFVSDEDALLPISDLGFVRGLAVCDIFRTYQKRPLHLADNLDRLEHSVKGLSLQMPVTREEIVSIIDALLDQFVGEEALVRTIITGGQSTDRFMPQGRPSLLISALKLITFPKELYESGASVSTFEGERPLPSCKTLFYGHAPGAIFAGAQWNAFEALYVNRQGFVTEGLTSNFFIIQGGSLITAPLTQVLGGITRKAVLKLAETSMLVEERPIHTSELIHIDEAFITSCTKEILPITSINGREVGDGTVGPHTKLLMQLFHNYTQNKAKIL